MSDKYYYIQCTKVYAHDYVLWWKPNRRGYTHNLNEAGLYSESEAQKICNGNKVHVAWLQDDVKNNTDIAVSIEKLRNAKLAPKFQSGSEKNNYISNL